MKIRSLVCTLAAALGLILLAIPIPAYATTTQPAVTASTSVGSEPYGIALSPNGDYAYVANYISNTVSVIQTSTNAVTDTVTVGTAPFSVAVLPDGDYIYVSNTGSSSVSVIQASTNTVVDTISVGSSPHAVSVSPNGDYVYVTNAFSDSVSVIQTSTNTVVDTISVGSYPYAASFAPNGDYIYVVNYSSGTVSVIQTSTNTVIDTITVGTDPESVAVSPNGDYAYVANYVANTISVIQTSTNTVIDTITVGTEPESVAVSPNGDYIYVANYSSSTLSIIQSSTNTVVDTLSVGSNPDFVAVSPNGDYAYTSDYGADTISVVSLGSDSGPVASTTGSLSVSNVSPSDISVPVDSTGYGSLPSASWSDTTGSGNGWQGSVAASDFSYTGAWTPNGPSPALASSSAGSYIGTNDGDTYTLDVTGVSGSTITYSYTSTAGATGTGTATTGTASNVGTNGISIIFSSTQTYATGNSYQVNVGTQNSSALTLEDQFSSASITAGTGSNTDPVFINQTASLTGTPGGYGTAVPFLSAAIDTGMGQYTVVPRVGMSTDNSSWSATYTANIEYTISSGPYAGSTTATTNFFPAGSFPTGLWESSPGNCNDWNVAQAVLTASIDQNAYEGYPAMVLSGSYGNACETQPISMPSTLVGGDTFSVDLAARTQGPLSAGPGICIWDTQANECLPAYWSPSPSNVYNWSRFNITMTLPSSYVYGNTLTLYLYSGETNGGPPAVNAYADVQMIAN